MFRFRLQLFGGRGQSLRRKKKKDAGYIAMGGTPDLQQFNKPKISEKIEDALKNSNPNYDPENPAWSKNCQRAVLAYTVRRRGYDVEAKPYLGDKDSFKSNTEWTKCIAGYNRKDSVVEKNTRIEVKSEIERRMTAWGNGAIAIVSVGWEEDGVRGHVFIAENVGGKIIYVDPQTHKSDVSGYFDSIKISHTLSDGSKLYRTELIRVDNATFTPVINKAVQNRKP